MTSFYGAQTFFLDPDVVSGARTVHLSRLSLAFRSKPKATGNVSGITNPGVTIFVVPTVEGAPDLSNIDEAPFVRAEYHKVKVSTNAATLTHFDFTDPVDLTTGREYGIVIKFDGDEDFVLWKNVAGEWYVGTERPSPGATEAGVGRWYDYSSAVPRSTTSNQPPSSLGASSSSSNQSVVSSRDWIYRAGHSCVFHVWVARFTVNGNPDLSSLANSVINADPSLANYPTEALLVSPTVEVDWDSGAFRFKVAAARYEFLEFDYRVSMTRYFSGGEKVWQVAPLYPNDKSPLTVSVSNNSVRVNAGPSVNLATVFDGGRIPQFAVFVSRNHAGGNTVHQVRKVVSVDPSGSFAMVDEPTTFSNSAAYFYRAAVGELDWTGISKLDGGRRKSVMILKNSTANAQVRFVNNSITSFNIANGGTGYSNSDLITVTGFESVAGVVVGGYQAQAAISTNSSGGITEVYMANLGAGFVSTPNVSITNSTGGSTGGSGANLVPQVGSVVASEFSYVPGVEGYAMVTQVLNQVVTEASAPGGVENFLGTYSSYDTRLSYFRERNLSTSSGWAYHVDDTEDENDVFPLSKESLSVPRTKKVRVNPSWSNELVITRKGSGTVQPGLGNSYMVSESSVAQIRAVANNDFTAVRAGRVNVVYGKYMINDDVTGEHTNRGSAVSKGVTPRVNLTTGTIAEDFRLFLTVWRPAGTDVVPYVRLHHSADYQAPDDKDWTRLVPIAGQGLFSSKVDEENDVELEFGLPSRPPTGNALAGTVTTVLSNVTVTGVGTSFTSSLANGDVVVITSPLFPATNYWVSTIEEVANNTSLTLTDPIANSGVVGTGLRIQKATLPNQAFVSQLNDGRVRYYTDEGSNFDGFSSFQIKLVMVSSDEVLVPKINDVRAVALSS